MVRIRAGNSPRAFVFAFVVLVSVAVALAWGAPAKVPAGPPEPVVAIADVHGDYDDFVAILRRAGLIDEQNHWKGGKTTFVQTGDLLDRGPKPREVVELMMSLEKEAVPAGGRVVSLLGNHEAMNIMGDLRYVTATNFASFADSQSEQRQKAAYEEYVKWRNGHAPLLTELSQPMELTESEWMARHPAGYVEHREAFAAKGKYGEWLRGHDAVAEIDGDIFLHGGIHPDLAKTKIEAINKRIHDEIKSFDASKQYLQDEKLILPFFNLQEITAVLRAELTVETKSRVPASERQAKIQDFLKLGEWFSVRPDGPLWFRGYDQWSDEEGAAKANKVLQEYKASHIIVGHTVQKAGRMRARFGDKVFLIDTGMLSSYYPGGGASALEICGDGKFVAVYLDQQAVLQDSAGASPKNGIADWEKLDTLPTTGICSAAAAGAH